jgi:hypothetical protein
VTSTLTDTLTRLAQSMESLQPAGAQPAWAEIIGPLESPDHVRWHPDLETMVGFTAPPPCQALASVGYGWAHPMDDDCPLLQPGERRRTRVVCLLSRAGDMAGYLRDSTSVLIREPPTVGRVPDLMRRCFGLPTPPPDQSSHAVLGAIWLNHIGARGDIADRALMWREVAELHPVIAVAAAGGVEVPAAQFARIIELGAEVWNWSHLLSQATTPGCWVADLLPDGAPGWMDEGIFSRWLVDALGHPARLLPRVVPYLEAAAAKRLRSTLTRQGVLRLPLNR